MGTRPTADGNDDQGIVVGTFDESGLTSAWRFQTGVTSGRFYVEIPENTRRAEARKAYRMRHNGQPPGGWSGDELVPKYLNLKFNGKRAVLRTKLIDGRDGDLQLPKHVFKEPSGEVALTPDTVWGYRRYRLIHPPAAYALAGLLLGLLAAGVNVSLAVGKTLKPPPIIISNSWVAIWQIIAAICSCAALAIVFWAGNIWEEEDSLDV